MLCGLNGYAQDEDDIARSINLTEVVVLADGMTFEEYLLKQVLANAKPLKERIQTLRYSVTCQLEKDMDLKKFPHRRTITFAARLAGYGPIVSALREHKHFGITMAEDVLFNKGKITTSNVRMVEMKQELTQKQIDSFLKQVKELQKKRKRGEDTGLRYSGSYTDGKRTYYIVELDKMKVHIADGCWQISRISYIEGQNNMYYECKEIKPGVFLLSHGNAKLFLDKEKWPKGYISMIMKYSYH